MPRVVQHGNLLHEVQFTFRSVLLTKTFSHPVYALWRVNLQASGGLRGALDAAFDLPRLGSFSAGGYGQGRDPDMISVKVSME